MADDLRAAISKVRDRCVHPPFVTAAAIAAVLATAFRYQVFARELSLDVAYRYGYSGRALSMGRWSTLVTSQFLTRNAFMAVSIALSLALMLGVYEMVAGSKRALLVTAVSAVSGPLLVAATLGIGSSLGSDFTGRTLSTLDYGASAVTAGAGGALVAALGMRRLRWFAIIWVIGGVFLHHQIADWEHVGSFIVGYGLGHVLGTAPTVNSLRRRFGWPHVSMRGWAVPAAAGVLVGSFAGAAGAGVIVPDRTTRPVVVTATGRRVVTAVSPASVVQVNYPSPSIGGTHSALVILPAGYDNTRLRYPVVEMLHGSPGTPADIITGLDPIAAAALPGMPPFIGVAPDGHGPVVSDGAFADTARQRLGTAISDDLRRWIDHQYRTNGHWSVTGLSSGGYGAAYLGSRRPGQYDSVCAMSGNFTPQGPAFSHASRAVLDAATPLLHVAAQGPRTLLITGVSDTHSVVESLAYAQALQRAGQPYQRVVVPGGHGWNVWKHAFPTCMRFMLTPPTRRVATS